MEKQIYEEVIKDTLSKHLIKRCRCANCGFISDYVTQVGDFKSYTVECLSCKSTALDVISQREESAKFSK